MCKASRIHPRVIQYDSKTNVLEVILSRLGTASHMTEELTKPCPNASQNKYTYMVTEMHRKLEFDHHRPSQYAV